jgi:hypothetical protein
MFAVSPEARRRFDEQFYTWALNDFYREIDKGFPFFHAFKVGEVPKLMAHLSRLRRPSQREFAEALVTRWWSPDARGDLMHLTERQKQIVDQYYAIAGAPRRYEVSLVAAESAQSPKATLDRRRFTRGVRKELDDLFGHPGERTPGTTCRYTARHGRWTVQTWVDTGGRFHQLSYAHVISAPEHVPLKEHISFLAWLGVSSQTMWSYLYDSDVRLVIGTLGRLCQHFLNALPILLKGLEPE